MSLEELLQNADKSNISEAYLYAAAKAYFFGDLNSAKSYIEK